MRKGAHFHLATVYAWNRFQIAPVEVTVSLNFDLVYRCERKVVLYTSLCRFQLVPFSHYNKIDLSSL